MGAPKSCAVCISAVRSLGKHEPPKPGPAFRNLRADAVVEADAARNLLHVGAGPLAQVRHLVDEGDLGRQEGIGRILDELGRAPAGEQQRRPVEDSGR